MIDRPLHELGALEVGALLAAGDLNSVALVEHLLDRIARHDAALRAVIAVHPDALAQASASDARRRSGAPRSALDGVPVVVKDNIEVIGLPGTAGSLALAGDPAMRDAALVERLRAAGLVILASTNLSEWANFRGERAPSGWSGVGGLTDNPWRTGRSCGGSSSGSGAALAARFAPLAIGTETDGSITCPAALCGVVGIKPTVGSVPSDGVVPIAASHDVAGPMARSVADAAALLDVLTGASSERSSHGAGHHRPRRFVLGAPQAWRTGHPGTDALVDDTIERLRTVGISVTECAVAVTDDDIAADEVTVLVHEMSDDLDAYLAGRPGDGPRAIRDVVAFNRAHAETELAHFGQEHLEAAVVSGGRSSPTYVDARRRNLAWALDDVLHPAFAHGVDALIAPAYGPAWPNRLDGGDEYSGGEVTHPAAIAGWPILTLPIGLVDGLPIGLAIVAPAGAEATLVAIGAAVEAAVEWTGEPPAS